MIIILNTLKSLSKEYAVGKSHIKLILTNKLWAGDYSKSELANFIAPITKKHNQKLNFTIAEQIREDYSSGNFTKATLSKKYKVGKSQTGRILAGECWLGENSKVKEYQGDYPAEILLKTVLTPEAFIKRNPEAYKHNIGKKHTNETKLKMSKVQTGRKHTPETILKMSGSNNSFFGKTHTDIAKQKLIASRIANNSYKLNIEKANEIRIKYCEGIDINKIAEEYQITKSNIYAVLANKTWRP